jgi:hypothetical protein
MNPMLTVSRGRLLADRDQLLAEANVARGRLAHTLDALGRKRHDLVDVGGKLRRRGRELALLGGVTVVLLAGMAGVSLIRRFRARRRAPRSEDLVELRRRDRRDSEPAAPVERRGFLGEFGPRLALGALAWLVLRLASRAGRRATRAQPPPHAIGAHT